MVELKKRLNLGSLMRHRSSNNVPTDSDADTPEANAARGVRLFCESGAANSGEEVLHLPTIVEAAVASPAAAAAAARQMRAFLDKDNYARPHVQYNSVMLIRILADNPGPSFTKNLDKHFADTLKLLLRNGPDPSVSHIVRDTLDAMERDKAYDTNLNALFAMWRKEKALMDTATKSLGPRKLHAPGFAPEQPVQAGFGTGSSRSKGLPPPQELVGRIEEARTSAKLLLQLVQSTPADELLANELVKEFAERCTTAQRSVHGYIACDNPAPDDDTMLTLIETNEQLSLAASKHQRAVLQARRLIPPPQPPRPNQQPPSHSPQQPAPSLPPINGASGQPITNDPPPQQRTGAAQDDPFADPHTSTYTPPPGPPSQQDARATGTDDPHPAPQRRRTPELHIPQQSPAQAHHVSPIAERNPVTYRY